MSALLKFRTQIVVFAIAATALFLPLSAGMILYIWGPFSFLAHVITPWELVISVMGMLPWGVCLALVAGGLAVVGAWLVTQQRWLRVLLLAGMLSILAFPLLYRYQPPVMAAPGHQLFLVTAPASFCESVRRRSEILLETRRCEYDLIGWDESETLFFNARCEGASEQLWAYRPDDGTPPAPVAAVPETLNPLVDAPAAIDYVRADVYPLSVEESVRALVFRKPWSLSPTGRWVAAAPRHVYGPEEVIIVSTQ